MLDFKVGKVYKDNSGREWEFVSYDPSTNFPYLFKNKLNNCVIDFCEQEGNFVSMYKNGGITKIPFVEEYIKWEVGKEYDCYYSTEQKISKAKLCEINNNLKKGKKRLYFTFDNKNYWLEGYGEIASDYGFVVFKNSIPEELKQRIENQNKKLTNKQKCFQKGQIYESLSGAKWRFIKRAEVSDGLVAIFDQEGITGNSQLFNLYRLNNIEFVLSNKNIYLCADESIRNKNVSKAVRVIQ